MTCCLCVYGVWMQLLQSKLCMLGVCSINSVFASAAAAAAAHAAAVHSSHAVHYIVFCSKYTI
jgi:hypothetical protein